jgi:uncharacterized repeat protein (TIGR01451 family)
MMKRILGWGQRYWVFAVTMLLLALAFAVAAPAWAAPPSADDYQTVPKPTPTSDSQPVATATPRPDDDDDDGGEGVSGDSSEPADREVPVFIIPDQAAVPASGLTASVTVANLNVREGPGIEFAVVGRLSAGDVVNVLWRNEDNTWLNVCCTPDTEVGGWVSSQLLSLDFDRAASAELIPVYLDETLIAQSTGDVADAQIAASEAATVTTSTALPIQVRSQLNPPFLRQGEIGDLVIRVSNPNPEDALNVELSDQLPAELELVETFASDDGVVEQQTTEDGQPLVLVTWDTVTAGDVVRLVLTVRVAEDVADGTVFDNLAAASGSNTGYATGSITIGTPPRSLPDFR